MKPNSSDRSKQRFQISSRFACTCPCEARGFVCRSLQGLKFSPVHVAVRSAEVTGSQDTGLQSPIKNKTSKHFYSLGRAQWGAGITNVRPLGSEKGLCLDSRLFLEIWPPPDLWQPGSHTLRKNQPPPGWILAATWYLNEEQTQQNPISLWDVCLCEKWFWFS